MLEDCRNKYRNNLIAEAEDLSHNEYFSKAIDLLSNYDTSILPYEDCCTIFVPKHPKTKPQLEAMRKSESVLDVEALVNKAIEETELVVF